MIETRFLRNAWYVAGWTHEFESNLPAARKIINEPVVFYRKTDGQLVALADRCAHRWAPLSLGRVEGDDLRCMYHGLKFSPRGTCVEVPHQDRIADALCVRAYPVLEKYRFVWIWMGNPEAASDDLVPDLHALDAPGWTVRLGTLDYEANYALVNDNLLDLSHLEFNHEKTLGRLPASHSGAGAKVIERGVRIEAWAKAEDFGETLRQMSKEISESDGSSDENWGCIDYLVPGIYRALGATYARGTRDECGGMAPSPERVPLYAMYSIQAVTPMTTNTSRYFYSGCFPTSRHTEDELDSQWEIVKVAFDEDLRMIEAQQKVIQHFPGRERGGIAADRGLVLFRKLMERLMEQDSETT